MMVILDNFSDDSYMRVFLAVLRGCCKTYFLLKSYILTVMVDIMNL